MLQTEASAKASRSEKVSVLRKTILVSLRVAFGVAILIYLAKSGRLDFSSLGRLQHEGRVTAANIGETAGDAYTRRYYRKLNRYSAALALCADVAMGVLGGKLKNMALPSQSR